jgi:hypothetical protein
LEIQAVFVELTVVSEDTSSACRVWKAMGAVEGAETDFWVPKGAFECFSSPSMLMYSISYKQLLLWHGRGRRFDPDQVHQYPFSKAGKDQRFANLLRKVWRPSAAVQVRGAL